jgi:hypothetical protein
VAVIVAASLQLHIVQLVDNLIFALNDLLDLSILCLINGFEKFAFELIDAVLELVEAIVDGFEVAS